MFCEGSSKLLDICGLLFDIQYDGRGEAAKKTVRFICYERVSHVVHLGLLCAGGWRSSCGQARAATTPSATKRLLCRYAVIIFIKKGCRVSLVCLLQEWFVWLSDYCDHKLGVCRWSGDLNRLHILCEWLVENELMRWFHLEHADDPGTWPGADAFAERELEFVRCFIAIGRSTPR